MSTTFEESIVLSINFPACDPQAAAAAFASITSDVLKIPGATVTMTATASRVADRSSLTDREPAPEPVRPAPEPIRPAPAKPKAKAAAKTLKRETATVVKLDEVTPDAEVTEAAAEPAGETNPPPGPKSSAKVLTEEKVREIKAAFRRKNPPQVKDVAARYDVTTGTIYNIVNGKAWTHVK